MALDTNIALGVKPVEQPNMLAQMGQMMQLRQAQQGFESENALRDFYAQGGDLSTAEGKRQLMSRAPGAGMKLIGQQSEISARDINTAEKSLAMMKNQAGLVRTPQDAANWLTSFYKNPLTRSYVESIAPLDVALAAIPNDPAGLETWLRRASLKADQIFESADAQLGARTRIQAANISAGPANARLAHEQKERAEADLLFGRPTSTAPVTAPMSGGGGAPSTAPMSAPAGGGVPNALPATVGATPAAPVANMLVPGAQAPATAPASAPAFAPTGDQFDKIKAIEAEITRLRPYMSNPRVAANVQQLNTERTQLMASAEREYGGNLIDMTIENPKVPGTYITVKGKLDQYGIAQPLKTGDMPRTVDINSGTSTDLPVARPAPRVGYQYNAKGEEVRIPQTGVPEGLKLKPGERWNEEKQVVEQVPGSAAFIEQQKKHSADLNAVKTTQTSTNWGTSRIDKILDPKNKTGFENNFGGFTAYGTKEFSGNTALVKSEIDSLKSDLKNRGLQIIRSGGSIGAITEKEWPIIESMIATLSPKMDVQDARDVLTEVRAKFAALENLAAEKYNDQWQGTQYHKPVSTARTSPASGAGSGVDTSNKFLQ
jgi:hypothetical protein